MVDLVDVNTNDQYSIKYIIKLFGGNTMVVTKEIPQVNECARYWINSNLLRGIYKRIKESHTRIIESTIFTEVLSTIQ